MTSSLKAVAVAADNSPPSFRTDRLDVAALLILKDASMSDAIVDGRHISFIFDDPDGTVATLARQHELGAVSVVSRRFAAAMDQIKDVVFQTRREAGIVK